LYAVGTIRYPSRDGAISEHKCGEAPVIVDQDSGSNHHVTQLDVFGALSKIIGWLDRDTVHRGSIRRVKADDRHLSEYEEILGGDAGPDEDGVDPYCENSLYRRIVIRDDDGARPASGGYRRDRESPETQYREKVGDSAAVPCGSPVDRPSAAGQKLRNSFRHGGVRSRKSRHVQWIGHLGS